MNIIFKEIIIIDKINKLAKIQKFSKGINIITSNISKGNYVGKSTLLKSLYHALGADLDFDSAKGWEIDSKYYYILSFYKDSNLFVVIRNDRTFTFYNSEKRIIFSTQNRDELKEFYRDFFKMTILLKRTESNYQYEAAKPFSLFCLSYVGQKHYLGCSFSSFNHMNEYSDIKDDIILSHLGLNDTEMNSLEEKNKELNQKKNVKDKNKEMLEIMIDKINSNEELNYSYDSIDSIKTELRIHEDEYKKKIEEISVLKKKMYELGNVRSQLLSYINELTCAINSQSNNRILKKHKCPLCENEITNYNEIFFKKVKVDDSLPIQLIDSNSMLADINHKIDAKMEQYEIKDKELKKLESILTKNNKSIENAITSMGIKKYKDSLISDLGIVDIEIKNIADEISKNDDKIKELRTKISEINKTYVNFLYNIKRRYEISIFDVPEKATIRNLIKCSDNYVLTTAWICVLNQLKHKFNPNGTFFPLVFDNPTDRDFDSNNTKTVLKMIFDEKKDSKQIIVSKLKFDSDEYSEYKIDNIINLTNPQYHLLNNVDYDQAIAVLTALIN